MKSIHRLGLAGFFILLAVVLSGFAYQELPAQLVTNWDMAGDPAGTMDVTAGIVLVPALMTGLLIIFLAIPRIDPLGANIQAFRRYYDWLVVVVLGYLLFLHAGIIAFNLGHTFDFVTFVLVGIAILFGYIGFLLPRAKRNWFVGIRTPWTLSSDEVWARTHHLGGRLFAVTAILALLGIFAGEYAMYFVLVPALTTAIVTVVYSYVIYERLDASENQLASP